jgi:hypothetical protein
MKHHSTQLGVRKNPDSLRVHGLRFTATQSSLSSVSSFSPDGRSSLGEADRQEYFSIPDLAKRWRCSRGTVYNRLRTHGAKVLDFAPNGKRGKKVVPALTVSHMEERQTKRLC